MKKALTLFTIALFTIGTNAQNANFEWAKKMGGIDLDQSFSIAMDASGNVYTTGFFIGTVDFDPGTGTFNLTSSASWDVFISKLDASGNFVWAKKMGGIDGAAGWSLVLDAFGNVYTTGIFQGTVDFDPGIGTFNLTSAGNSGVFISKLDASGNFIWAKQLGGQIGTIGAGGPSLVSDALGNIYTTGTFSGTADFDPGIGTFNLTSAGNTDIFISKLDASGNFIWAKQLGGSDWDYGASIQVDASGNVYTTGYFEGTADFDPGTGTFYFTAPGIWMDIFISKLDTSGNFVWAKQMGSTAWDKGISITLDNLGNIYTTGHIDGINPVDFDPGSGIFMLNPVGHFDIFIQKLDASGNFVWAKLLGGTEWDVGNYIQVDALGNVYTTGTFQGTSDFDPGTGTYNLTSMGGDDIFISKLDSSGNFVWTKRMGGIDNDVVSGITVDVLGNLYTTGYFEGIVDFDPGQGTFNLTSAGLSDIFILKLSQCTNGSTDIIMACDSITWINGNTYTTSNNTATYTLTNAAGCDSVVTLNLTIANNTGTDVQSACDSYTWIDGNTYTTSNNTATHTLTNTAGCDSVITLNLTINTVDNSVIQNGINLSANQTGASFQWLDCDNSFSIIIGANSQNYTATVNGNFAVEINQNGCVDTSACYTISMVDISEIDFGNDLIVFPNPNDGNFNIQAAKGELEIYNTLGELIHSQIIRNKKAEIDLSHQANGIYFVNLITKNKTYSTKILLQK